MQTRTVQQIENIIARISEFGKENLEEILHKLTEGVQLLAGGGRCRIYLEDLTMGALTCAAAAGGDIRQIQTNSFPINDSDFLVPQVYQQKQELAIDDLSQHPEDIPLVSGHRKTGASYLLPITQLGRAIGVLCLDHAQPGRFPAENRMNGIRKLLAETSAPLDRARKYHQQLQLARRVDEAKKREA